MVLLVLLVVHGTHGSDPDLGRELGEAEAGESLAQGGRDARSREDEEIFLKSST
ncbi:hypothetical protein ACGF3G_30875 [Streptomyces sp. NPDC048179]|uniref:hypothetical protein n=1 Tax=Streptomyces sp. NPDC048179 TaxID=3365506 RepID=UPI003715FEDA